jgi:hypothetical protein
VIHILSSIPENTPPEPSIVPIRNKETKQNKTLKRLIRVKNQIQAKADNIHTNSLVPPPQFQTSPQIAENSHGQDKLTDLAAPYPVKPNSSSQSHFYDSS